MESQASDSPVASSPIRITKSRGNTSQAPSSVVFTGSKNQRAHFRPKLPAPFMLDKASKRAVSTVSASGVNSASARDENGDAEAGDENLNVYSYLDRDQLSAAVRLARLDLQRKHTRKAPRAPQSRGDADELHVVKESGIAYTSCEPRVPKTKPTPRTTTTQTAVTERKQAERPRADHAAEQLSQLRDDMRFLLHQSTALGLGPEVRSRSPSDSAASARQRAKPPSSVRYREFLDQPQTYDNSRPFQLSSVPQSSVTATGLRPRARAAQRAAQVVFGYPPEAAVRVTRVDDAAPAASHRRTHTERVLVDLAALSAEADRLLKELGEVSEPLAAGNSSVRQVYERRLSLLHSAALDTVRRTLDRFESARHSSRCLASVYSELRKLFAKLGSACVLFRAPSQLRVEHVVRSDSASRADAAVETDPEPQPQPQPSKNFVQLVDRATSASKPPCNAECARTASRNALLSRSPTESWLAHSGREFHCRSRTASNEPPSPKKRSTPVHLSPPTHSRAVQSNEARDAQVQASDPDRIAALLRQQPPPAEQRRYAAAESSESADAFPLFHPRIDPPSKSQAPQSDGRQSPFSVDVVLRRIDSLQGEQQRIRDRWLQLAYSDLHDPALRVHTQARLAPAPAHAPLHHDVDLPAKPIHFHQPRYDDAVEMFAAQARSASRKVLATTPARTAVLLTVDKRDADAARDYRSHHNAFLRHAAGLHDHDSHRLRPDPEASNAVQQSVRLVDRVSEAIVNDCVGEAVSELDSAMHTIVQQLVAHELFETPNAPASHRSPDASENPTVST